MKTLILLLLGLSIVAKANPDWSEHALIPEGGRGNPYQLPSADYQSAVHWGKIHTQHYPVDITGMLLPLKPMKNFIEEDSANPLKSLIQSFFQGFLGVEKFYDFIGRMGLHPYPQNNEKGVYTVPYPQGQRPEYPMGFTPMQRDGALGFTFGCAACHSGNLFGKTVLGLTNRFPRANEVIFWGKQLVPFVDPTFFRIYNHATAQEENLLRQTMDRTNLIGATVPLIRGLDTSLAQVSLSLARREPDAYATRSPRYERWPRESYFDKQVADSKPAVWWNLKYKNRWLSDGSVVSGNPVFTNILWNELGRGADLKKLEIWLENNTEKIKQLTTAVFSIEAPLITDFFPAERIDIEKAKRGQKIFEKSCARCHGYYDKAWQRPDADQLSPIEKLKTTLVRYSDDTEVSNVGTDPQRYLGMQALEKLNDLQISQKNSTVIKPQKGYVPPPLVGIWARWPYLHNNSIPSLCALLTESAKRPKVYLAREANDPNKDFDFECNGYPVVDENDIPWEQWDFEYDTTNEGMSNQGHDKGIFIKDGKEILTPQNKKDLIQYLQTL